MCTVCKALVSRGGISVANFNTSSLTEYLKTHYVKDSNPITSIQAKQYTAVNFPPPNATASDQYSISVDGIGIRKEKMGSEDL